MKPPLSFGRAAVIFERSSSPAATGATTGVVPMDLNQGAKSRKVTTAEIKATLRKRFPDCSFSVTSEGGFSGGRVSWTDDGPTEDEVESAISAAGLRPGRPLYFDRYSVDERAVEQQEEASRQAEWQQKRQEEAERAAAAKREARSFWAPQEIPPLPLLAQLYDFVLGRNEKRLPKWKFKLVDDLAVQIHPQLTRAHALLFDCVALEADDLSIKFFLEPKLLHGRRPWRCGFRLFAEAPNAAAWTFKPRSVSHGREDPTAGWGEFRQRVVAALHPDRFADLHPDKMLSPHCLCCGKGLTDPVSMARWVGPECWGSASTNLPRVFKAMATPSNLEGAP
jgi:Large polyvalent protein associated domain 29/Family of unknown function (DUF6011)